MYALDRLARRRDQSVAQVVQQLTSEAGLIQQRVDAISGRHVLVNGRWLLNFASSDYLGLAGHSAVRRAMCSAATKWGTSLSQPRLWATDRLTATLEQRLAQLVGQERALVFSSTVQIAHDVLPILAGPRGVILIDEFAYPISQRAAAATGQGGPTVRRFHHNNPERLSQILRSLPHAQDKVIVCDGVYMSTGETATLAAFDELAQRHHATIYLDDAQGIGLLGHAPSTEMAYGHGGEGSAVFCGVPPGRLVYASTLAKALGVPLAFVAGPAYFIKYLRRTAFSHIHSSPPALPMVAAALAAVQVNSDEGEQLRRHLLRLVRAYRSGVGAPGHEAIPVLPMQTIYVGTPRETLVIGAQLRYRGIWPVIQLRPEENPAGGAVRFLFTAAHRMDDVSYLLAALKVIFQRRTALPLGLIRGIQYSV